MSINECGTEAKPHCYCWNFDNHNVCCMCTHRKKTNPSIEELSEKFMEI